MSNTLKKASKATVITFIVYAVLVATHLGEFWPFSIFPMFSQAGNPWTRAMSMDVTDDYEQLGESIWTIDTVGDLPGTNFALRQYGVDQIDFANFVSKTRDWNDIRIQALRNMVGEQNLETRYLMVYKVSGEMTPENEVVIVATPFILLTPQGHIFNPLLPEATFFSE
jgi:hypothetical protein